MQHEPVEPTAASATEFADGFAEVQERLSGPAGIALVPVGGGQELLAGERTTGWAWSISKVPLALAALRESDGEAARTNAALALQASDNDAAAALWRGLGGGDAAAEAIEDVLREAGDPTDVPGGPDAGPRPGFGGTTWSLIDSADFTARLPCLPGAKRVLFNMRNVSEVQQWGFWRVPEAAVKGGWGPVDGGYLVRQVAVIPTADGEVAASALVYSPTLEQGERDLDAIAEWAATLTEPLGGRCTGGDG